MSWYYTYYLAERDKDTGLLVPLGPFDKDGKLMHVLCKSRSFASHLHERFWGIKQDDCDSAMVKALFGDNEIEESDWRYVSACSLSALPDGDILKRVYVKVSDIAYMESDDYDGWSDVDEISVAEYTSRRENQLAFNCEPFKDCEGNECTPIWEYAYYPYIDRDSEEYEAYIIRNEFSMIYENNWDKRDCDAYAVLVQG